MASADGVTIACSQGHPMASEDSFCPQCGSPAVPFEAAETTNESAGETTTNPKAGPQRLWMTAIGAAVVIALAVVILIAATSSGSNSSGPQQDSPPPTTAYSASQICADNAKVWVAKALADLSSGVDPSQTLMSAVTIYGTQSQTYQTIIDAFSKVSTVAYQQGVMTAARQARSIIDSDCSNSSSSRTYSGASRSVESTTTTSMPVTTTTQPYIPPTTEYIPPSTTTTTSLVEVPFLIWKTPGEASALLQAVGLTLGSVTPSAPDPNGTCVGDNTTWNIPSGSIQEWTVRGSNNGSYAPAGSIVDVTVCP